VSRGPAPVNGGPATLSGPRRPATPSGATPSGATAIVTALAGAGTRVMFGVPGGGPNLDVVGAAAAAGLRFVLTHTETAAAIMAATSADLTGAPGAVLVTRGPGLASAVNGIAHAALDRLPLVVISDTVRAAEAGRVSHQRLDQGALGRSVAKAAVTVGGDRAAQAAARAVSQALAAPPGPVIALMDDGAPADLAGSAGDTAHDGHRPGDPHAATPGPHAAAPRPPADGLGSPADDLAPLAAALRQARRPVLLLGAHARTHTAAIRAAVVGRGIPALHTYRARGIVPDSAGEAGGLVTGGTMEWPLLAQADLIIGLGVDEAELIPAAWDYAAPTLLVVDWPAAQTGATGYFTGATALTAPLPAAIDLLAGWTPAAGPDGRGHPAAPDSAQPPAVPHPARPGGPRWGPGAGRAARTDAARRLREAAAGPRATSTPGTLSGAATAPPGALAPQQVAAAVRAHTPADTIATVDAGAHMLAVMPLWEVDQPGRLLISSGLATMGFALPAAIAAALCAPGQPVVAFTGDGGLGMTLAEIETAVRLRLRIVVIVFNDATLSLIKIKQRAAGQGGAEAVDYGPVSFAGVATAMGAAAAAAITEPGLVAALAAALRRDGPTVIDAAVDPACYPAVMELTRGDAGRRAVPGLIQAGGNRTR
jgi:acetolactate synthase I/II/III large subunit